MTLRDRADALRRHARDLLRDTGVVDVFAQLGAIHFVGSYRLDVMYRPDIDLIVTTDEPQRDQATAQQSALPNCWLR